MGLISIFRLAGAWNMAKELDPFQRGFDEWRL